VTEAAQIVGVDGWSRRWVAAEVRGRSVTWQLQPAFQAVLDAYPQARIGIDMPIGLPGPDQTRVCDRRAREVAVGAASSVFPAPSRGAVQAWREGDHYGPGLGISAQAWNLIPAIAQVDRSMTPELQNRIIEVHPECSFRTMGYPIDASKKTGRGVGQRIRALSAYFDLGHLADAPKGPAIDDLLDAAAAAWTAQRWRDGRAIAMPEVSPAPRDGRELAMQIWR
jgi:predicted RNase H-like nuclease